MNNKKAGIIAWPPYELDISGYIQDGENEIDVRVTGSLKNTFGYFYEPNDRVLHGPHMWNLAPEKKPDLGGMYLMDYGLYDGYEIYGHLENE